MSTNDKQTSDKPASESQEASKATESKTALPEQTTPSENGPDNRNEDKTKSAKANPSENAKTEMPKVSDKPAKSSGAGKAILWLLLLVLLGGLGFGGWWLYGNFDRFAEPYLEAYVDQRVDAIEQANQRETAALKSQLAQEQRARRDAISELQQLTDSLSNQLNSQSGRLRELAGTTRTDWLLAEAEYLIRLGIQRFITERNTANAIALMESADQVLSQLDEVGLLPVRRTLARDITNLKLRNNIDREGIYLRLNAAAEAVMQLPLIPRQPDAQTVEASDQQPPTNWWQRLSANLSRALTQFHDLIRVQRRSGAMQPLLSVQEEAYIRHNLRFMLEQAQLALLREEPLVYQQSLDKAITWLEDYFQLDNRALISELQQLRDLDVLERYPNISGGLEALHSFTENWHNRYRIDQQPAEEMQ